MIFYWLNHNLHTTLWEGIRTAELNNHYFQQERVKENIPFVCEWNLAGL